jgi:hypothetical protein
VAALALDQCLCAEAIYNCSTKRSSKKIHAVNGGHPTQFDETGNPVYDPEQV